MENEPSTNTSLNPSLETTPQLTLAHHTRVFCTRAAILMDRQHIPLAGTMEGQDF